MSELGPVGIAACYRGLTVLSGAMEEWMGVCHRANVDIWLPDGPICRIQRHGRSLEVLFFEDAASMRAWQAVVAGEPAPAEFKYVRISSLPVDDDEPAAGISLQHFESFGRPAAVDDLMANRVERVCRHLAASLRDALRRAA